MRIGFDLGGTKMLAAVLDAEHRIIGRAKNKTERGEAEEVFRRILTTIDEALDDAGVTRADIEAVGIAVPGLIDRQAGVVVRLTNIGMQNFPIADRLSAELDAPVSLDNDVNAGLWGEHAMGAAQGFDHVIGIFPGTGIGGGLILDGHLYRGKSGGAGEIGHITVQSDGRRCGCGNHGCLETVASKTAIARDLAVLALNGSSPVLAEAGATDITRVKSGLIKRALEAGDPGVAEVVDQAARFLGIGMAAMVNTFDPQVIVLGGGLVEKLGSYFTDRAEAMMRERAMDHLAAGVEVHMAQLGDDAVVTGVADLATGHSSDAGGYTAG